MKLVAFILSEVDKWHQCQVGVLAYDDFYSTTGSIKIMKHLYILNILLYIWYV